MLQDIYPHHFDNTYKQKKPRKKDFLLMVQGDEVWLKEKKDQLTLPTAADVSAFIHLKDCAPVYLFSVDGNGFYLVQEPALPEDAGLVKRGTQIFREMQPGWLSFAGITGCQLSRWYHTRRFCGRCAETMVHSKKERAMTCPQCGNIEYPKISPVVIVGITNGNKLLMTKYARGAYSRYALVAGFMEIGETFEDTVRREVMEEVGLEVENIRYYKIQPWAFSDSLLGGFFCDLKGSSKIKLDFNELSEGLWMEREDIPLDGNKISLTYEMMEAFKLGVNP